MTKPLLSAAIQYRFKSQKKGLNPLEERLNTMEKEMASMRKLVQEIESRNPSLIADASATITTDPTTLPPQSALDPVMLEDLYDFYGLQPIELWPLSEFLKVRTVEDLIQLASHVHREYLVRLAHRARTLRHAPLGLAQMPSIRELRRWYETSFADMRSFESLKTKEDLVQFDAVVRRILVRHRNTADLLSNGLYEFASREQILAERKLMDTSQMKVYREVQHFFDTFCDTRVRLRFMLGHHANLSAKILADSLPADVGQSDGTARQCYGLDPETFIGHMCTHTDARKVIFAAIKSSRESEVEDTSLIPEVTLIVNQVGVPPYTYTGEDSPSHGTPFTFYSVPSIVYGSGMAIVGEAIRANVIRKLRFGLACEPIKVEITQGGELSDVTITATDTAGGMALPVLNTSLTCVASCRAYLEEQQLCKKGTASFNRLGCGWSHCPIRMPYAAVASRVFGGDVSVSSMESVGTSRSVFVSTNKKKLNDTLV